MDVLQIVKTVKEVKTTADAGTQLKAVRPGILTHTGIDENGEPIMATMYAHVQMPMGSMRWSVLRAEMEALCGDIMGDAKRGNSGATLLSPLEKGHLMFICEDGCFNGVTLKDIERCNFPGAVGKEPVSSLWAAWIATSIFQRTDIGLGEKIRLHREGAICLDGGALKDVLKMAYNKCIDWTDFISNTRSIAQHAPIQGRYFEESYNEALRAVRQELSDDEIKSRPQKEGPVGYLAGEGALALEKDGQKGDIVTKMATTFERLLEVLEEWSACRSWVIMWPIDPKMDEERSGKLLQLVKAHLIGGGKIITVWPPVNEKNVSKWRDVQGLWSALDGAILRLDDGNQVFVTASSLVVEGKLYIEAGSPESSGQYFSNHVGAGVPKGAYEAARKKAVGALLPSFPDYRLATSRAMSSEREGMLGRGGQGLPVKRRAH